MNSIKASVIITVYNSAFSCIRTLESVIKQTYTNLEIIIVDDHSDDFDELVVNVSKLCDSRIKIVRQPKNLKAPAARNRGARESTGDILFFLDADDIWESDRVEKGVIYSEQNKIVISKMGIMYSDNYNKRHETCSCYSKDLTFAENLFSHGRHNLIFQTSSISIKRDDFFKTKGFNESLSRHQDYQFVFDLEDLGFGVVFINETLVYYVKNKNVSVMRKGWSIEASVKFIDMYSYKFNRDLLMKFVIVQLLGPSLKSKVLYKWFHLAKKLDILDVKLLFNALLFAIKRSFCS